MSVHCVGSALSLGTGVAVALPLFDQSRQRERHHLKVLSGTSCYLLVPVHLQTADRIPRILRGETVVFQLVDQSTTGKAITPMYCWAARTAFR